MSFFVTREEILSFRQITGKRYVVSENLVKISKSNGFLTGRQDESAFRKKQQLTLAAITKRN